jgi:RNase adapter protein RapZ
VTSEQHPVFILLGPAGAGISTALSVFREFHYITVGNVNLEAIRQSYASLSQQHPAIVFHLALPPHSCNIHEVKIALEAFKLTIPNLRVLYLSTPTDILLQRYQLNKKTHPYSAQGDDLRYTIEQEQLLYQALKPLSDYHIDTSLTTDDELRHKIAKVLNIQTEQDPMAINIMSFGFKRGVPTEADLVFDVRFLPNPFYDVAMRPLTGLDKPVQDYVYSFEETQLFVSHLEQMFRNLIPAYQRQGKTRLTIAIGCTGGQHRSVFISETFAQLMREAFPESPVRCFHREMPHWPNATQQAASQALS